MERNGELVTEDRTIVKKNAKEARVFKNDIISKGGIQEFHKPSPDLFALSLFPDPFQKGGFL